MQKILLTLIGTMLLTTSVWSQKMGYVNTEVIMEQIPEYTEAQQEIDRFSQQWQSKLEEKYAEIERMYAEYAAQEVLMSEDLKERKQMEIFRLERDAKEYREEKFGYNGQLFQLQENQIQPIMDRIMRAVNAVAQRRRVALVFDKAGETTWLYTDATYDLTDEVLEELGIGEDED